MSLKINVLGTEYTVNYYDYDELPIFEERSIDGYQDDFLKEIAIVNIKTYPGFENETDEYCKLHERHTLRHEIVHAFLTESGLSDSSAQLAVPWSKNEEMVDWIAIQFPKIMKVFEEADCL